MKNTLLLYILAAVCLPLSAQDTVYFQNRNDSLHLIEVITNSDQIRFKTQKGRRQGIIQSVKGNQIITRTEEANLLPDRSKSMLMKKIYANPAWSDSIKQVKIMALMFPYTDTFSWQELESVMLTGCMQHARNHKLRNVLNTSGTLTYYGYQICCIAFRKIAWIQPVFWSLFLSEGSLYLYFDRKRLKTSDWNPVSKLGKNKF